MESKSSASNPQDFLSSAAVLLLKSSLAITERCREDIPTIFSNESDSSPMVQELLAFLGSIVLHEAHAKNPKSETEKINQTCHRLKDALVPAAGLSPEYSQYAQCFDDQAFHELMASYFNGNIEDFGFPPEELQRTSEFIRIPVPRNRGIETLFFALMTRLIRQTKIPSLPETEDRAKAAAQLTQFVETGISSFGLALQLL